MNHLISRVSIYYPLILFLFLGCQSNRLLNHQLDSFILHHSYTYQNDELNIQLKNTVHCPIRVWVQAEDPSLKSHLDSINPITLKPLNNRTLTFQTDSIKDSALTFAYRLGAIEDTISTQKVELPFPKGKRYRMIQGYNSKPTHNTDWSRYALDFGLSIGDTICAATSGYVVDMIEEYKYGGEDSKWKKYGNYLTIFDPSTRLFTQYVHLTYKGSLVKVGDYVKVGQKIGISGMTGQTNVPHLHFNCLKPVHSKDGLISIPLDSIGPYKVSEIQRNAWITH